MLPLGLFDSAADGFSAAAFAFFAISLSNSFPCLLLKSSNADCRSFCRILRKSNSRSFGNLLTMPKLNSINDDRMYTSTLLTCRQYIHDSEDRL